MKQDSYHSCLAQAVEERISWFGPSTAILKGCGILPRLASEGQTEENAFIPTNDLTICIKIEWSGSPQCHGQMAGQLNGRLPANGDF